MSANECESPQKPRKESNALRGVLITVVLYTLIVTIIANYSTDRLADIIVANIILGGLLLFFMRTHAREADGLSVSHYLVAVVVPAIAGTVYYLRNQQE
ncbi:hypothetical protein [Halorussus aquaticus]|uniref:Cardiolipin synthase N-terminal domain-containing protein n=1 Tax=Halorussus aquaticus TaxID=2953748 RepID=A0ABD5Q3J2_9EURY|nr:hypothetical protein [Halorussus aquaticus]